MSDRHQNTTWRAIDADLLASLRAVRHDATRLEPLLAASPVLPEANPAHCEEVWRRPVSPILRPYLLRHFIRQAPARWAPPLAEAIVEQDDEFAEDCFLEIASRFELYSVPDTFGVVVYTSESYARRFFALAPGSFAGAKVILRAFGGEPDPHDRGLASCLQDALSSADEVAAIAEAIVVPEALPPLEDLPPESDRVWRFEADPTHLLGVIREVASFFRRAAAAGLAVQVHWHPNP